MLRGGNTVRICVDGKPVGAELPGGLGLVSTAWSPDGARFVVGLREISGTRCAVAENGVERAQHDDIDAIRFAPDGRLVYAARDEGKWALVTEKGKGERFDAVLRTAITSRGPRVACLATRDGAVWLSVQD